MLFVFINVFLCNSLFSYPKIFVTFNSNATGVTCGAGTAFPSGAHMFIPWILEGIVILDDL